MRGRAPTCRRLAIFLIALCAGAALATALAWNSIFESAFNSQIKLSPQARGYNDWVAPSVPLFFDVYLFNWTNAEQFPEEIPDLVEIGPYRFREHRRHVNVTFHPQNHSVSYRTQRSWYFDETSNGTLQDNITILNVIAASAIYRSRHWGFLRQKGLSMGLAMFGHGMSISRLAGELLFDGYEDPLLDLAKSLPSSTTGGAPPVDRFGLFYERNNSMDTEGLVEVTTGEVSGTLPGQILRWNNYETLPYYSGECAKITGSAGEFMPHNLTEEGTLTMFVPDLCRTVNLEYEKSGIYDGLPYHKYTMTEISFDNSTRTPVNSCFCNGDCGWGGLMNVSACRYGSPSFLSLPHFLHGDPELREKVRGMNPDPELHSFYFAIEPRLGVPLDVAGRFQYNVFIEPCPNIALYEHVPKMMFPIFWVEQHVRVSSEVTAELRMVRGILDWGGAVCACAALLFASLVLLATCCTKKSQYTKPEEIISEKPKDEAEIKLTSI
ncbi:protein peste-like isoform X1 [Vanessa atalanta]|uniref:protein peste-like isoform X1 n=2 Tax=Vanessa atalanta TaxID=42275 RepID=UPI001FCD1531|nr:protein peste-like isoform X1 [Vanessa atalanta]XP_047530544.1 protein peste-like isoform X1 [Vanessa atalanta]